MRQYIFNEIDAERAYQDGKWGHRTDDTLNTPWMWAAYIAAYATKWMVGTFAPLQRAVTDDFRAKMIKTAAICVAAVESIDRQRAGGGSCFFETGATKVLGVCQGTPIQDLRIHDDEVVVVAEGGGFRDPE